MKTTIKIPAALLGPWADGLDPAEPINVELTDQQLANLEAFAEQATELYSGSTSYNIARAAHHLLMRMTKLAPPTGKT